MSETGPRSTVTLRTVEGEEKVFKGFGTVILSIDRYNGNKGLYKLDQAIYGEIRPIHVARQILRVIDDQSESTFADFWREVVAYVINTLQASEEGEDVSDKIGGLSADEAFARDAIDRAEGRA